METLHGVINDINSFLWTYVIIIALIGSGIIFTLRTKFVQLRLVGEMVKLIFGSAGQKTSGKEISGFQAFCVSTASRVVAPPVLSKVLLRRFINCPEVTAHFSAVPLTT